MMRTITAGIKLSCNKIWKNCVVLIHFKYAFPTLKMDYMIGTTCGQLVVLQQVPKWKDATYVEQLDPTCFQAC